VDANQDLDEGERIGIKEEIQGGTWEALKKTGWMAHVGGSEQDTVKACGDGPG